MAGLLASTSQDLPVPENSGLKFEIFSKTVDILEYRLQLRG
jgi:hypothetical protein